MTISFFVLRVLIRCDIRSEWIVENFKQLFSRLITKHLHTPRDFEVWIELGIFCRRCMDAHCALLEAKPWQRPEILWQNGSANHKSVIRPLANVKKR